MSDSTRRWLKAILRTAIHSASSTVAVLIADPEHFNPAQVGGLRKLGTVVVISGIVGVFLYLRDNPIPNDNSVPKETGRLV